MITEIKWHDTRYSNINAQITRCEQRINILVDRLEDHTQVLSNSTNAKRLSQELLSLFPGISENLVDQAVIEYFRRKYSEFQNEISRDISYAEHYKGNVEEELQHTRLSRASYLEQLENHSSVENSLTLSDLRAALKKLGSCIKARSTMLFEKETEQGERKSYIQVIFEKLQYEVVIDEVPSWVSLHGNNQTISIPLALVKTIICPENGNVQFVHQKRRISPYEWGGTVTVHPHVLVNHEPCLGDFAAPYREAVQDKDWTTVFSLLKLFLTRAIDQDTAGRQWVKYFLRHSGGGSFAIDDYVFFRSVHPNHLFKIVEQEVRGAYRYEAYKASSKDRDPTFDFDHPLNVFLTGTA